MILPFSIGCVSQSSVAVAEDRPSAKKSLQSEQTLPAKFRDVDGVLATEKAAHNKGTGFLPLPPRPNLAAGFQRVIKGFRGITSQLFAYKDDGDEEEEEERELQIGFPTDVQHVGHIGWDGTNTNALSNMMAWDGNSKQQQQQPPSAAAPPPDLLNMPSISLRQFQMVMAAQADDEDDDIHGGYPFTTAPRHHQIHTAAAYYN